MPERDKNITELIGVVGSRCDKQTEAVAVKNKSTQLLNDDGGGKNATADRDALPADGTAETTHGTTETADGAAE